MLNRKLSTAECVVLSIFDGTPLHDIEMDYPEVVAYVTALREATEYDPRQADWVKRPNYPQVMAKHNR